MTRPILAAANFPEQTTAGLPPAEQLSREQLRSLGDDHPYHLPTSWQGVHRGRDGRFYEFGAYQDRIITPTRPINILGFTYNKTEKYTIGEMPIYEVKDPKFYEAAALYELNRRQQEFVTAVASVHGYFTAAAELASAFHPLIDATVAFSGQTVSGNEASLFDRGTSAAGLGKASVASILLAKGAKLGVNLLKHAATIKKINNRMPINYAHAGRVLELPAGIAKKHNVSGIRFSNRGFPEFTPVAKMQVTFKRGELTGELSSTFALS